MPIGYNIRRYDMTDSDNPKVIERRKRYVDLIITEIERLERILEKLKDLGS